MCPLMDSTATTRVVPSRTVDLTSCTTIARNRDASLRRRRRVLWSCTRRSFTRALRSSTDLSSTTGISTVSLRPARSKIFASRSVPIRHANLVRHDFSNKTNWHFHCTRPNCGFSFVKYSTMAIHEANHNSSQECDTSNNKEYENERSSPVPGNEDDKMDLSSPEVVSPMKTTGKSRIADNRNPESDRGEMMLAFLPVKAAGTFYPLSAFQEGDSKNRSLKPKSNSNLLGRPPSPKREQQSPENLSNKKPETLDFSVQKPEPGRIQPASPSKLFPNHSPKNFILNPNFGDGRNSGTSVRYHMVHFQNQFSRI